MITLNWIDNVLQLNKYNICNVYVIILKSKECSGKFYLQAIKY